MMLWCLVNHQAVALAMGTPTQMPETGAKAKAKVVAAVDATVLAIEAEAEVESKWTFIS